MIDTGQKAIKFPDLHVYVAVNRMRKYDLCEPLGVSRFQLSGLLYPDRYAVSITDEMVERIAALLNQPVSYVRKLYRKAA